MKNLVDDLVVEYCDEIEDAPDSASINYSNEIMGLLQLLGWQLRVSHCRLLLLFKIIWNVD